MALLAAHQHIRATDVAAELGIAERTARELLAGWVAEDWLVVADPSRQGRRYALTARYRRFIGGEGQSRDTVNPFDTQLATLFDSMLIDVEDSIEHDLRPVLRHRMYSRLFELGLESEYKRITIQSVEHVLHLWVNRIPKPPIPQLIIEACRNIVAGDADCAHYQSLYGDSYQYISGDAYDYLTGEYYEEPPVNSHDAFWVAAAAFAAFRQVCGRYPFADVEITDEDCNSDLDEWSSDSPKCAAVALADHPGAVNNDSAKRMEFWLWWLNMARHEVRN